MMIAGLMSACSANSRFAPSAATLTTRLPLRTTRNSRSSVAAEDREFLVVRSGKRVVNVAADGANLEFAEQADINPAIIITVYEQVVRIFSLERLEQVLVE